MSHRAAAIALVGSCLACGEARLIPRGYWSAQPDGGPFEAGAFAPPLDATSSDAGFRDAMSPIAPDSGTADGELPPPGEVPQMCTLRCMTAADCDESRGPLFDADNYVCVDGRCEWQGCNSDDECLETPGPFPWVCRPTPDFQFRACVPGCNHPMECIFGEPLFGYDNFVCENGGCWFLGCNDDRECIEAFMDERYRCAATGTSPLPQCTRICREPVDCVGMQDPLHGEDNFACTNGLCHWLGCRDADECGEPSRYLCE